MTAIERLDAAARDRIAAGEVVTRPARVVAELLDNALDAGAERVEVEVAGDGTDLIRVRDDGHGMGRDDAERAVARHATSKIGSASELDAVETLGFRGEALPAIAAVSRFDLVTNDGGDEGTRVALEGGDDPTVEPAARARGTTVTVRDLFFNRPPRRESLAGTRTEFGRVADLVTRYALCRPSTAFCLLHDDRETLSTPGTGVRDAVLAAYGRDAARAATAVDATSSVDGGSVRVRGLLAAPATTRASPDHVHLAVRGRPLAEAADLRRAVERGYGALLSDGRHPVAALRVDLPAALVDPNVHPAKARVGLRAGEAVATAVERAVADALSTADLARAAETSTDVEAALEPADGAGPLADARIVGQYRARYLLCEADDDLLVVDQHAAHERVNFERLRAAVGDGGVPSAPLDPPATLDLDPGGVETVRERRETLARLGFDVEPFGGTTVRVRATPAPFGRTAAPESLRETVDALRSGREPDPQGDLLADLACHPSLKAGDALDDETARTLVDALAACETPYACPHGRPTVLTLAPETLASGFERAPTRD
ncbi:MAG: DNA mismatch repair endonuclease MutL [Haloferacaceae archaeon]